MTTKLYHWILFITCLGLIVCSLAVLFLPSPKWMNSFALERLKDMLALFILYVQTSYGSRFIQRSNITLSFFAMVGYLFVIQHWPFGKIFFIGALALICLLLIWDSLKHKATRGIHLCILAFPTIHLIVITGYMYRIHAVFLSDILALMLVAIGVGRKVLKS